jgi:gluconolactonase
MRAVWCFLGLLAIAPCSAEEAVPAGDPRIVAPGARWELLWDDGEFTEGVAVSPSGEVYFSDIGIAGTQPGRIMKFSPQTGKTEVYVADSGQSNGLFFDRQGRLLAVCGANRGHRGLCEVTPRGTLRILVDRYQGKRFNAPNDLVVHPGGWVYFSDPRYVGFEPLELDPMSVYRWTPGGKVVRATDAVAKPNGVILSPGGKILYVAETDNGSAGLPDAPPAAAPGRMTLNAFPVAADGSLGEKRVIVDFGKELGIDGMSMDVEGHIYAAVRSEKRHGIVVYSPEGKELAHLPTEALPTNCTFGTGDDSKILYATVGSGLYRIPLQIAGYHPELAP